MGNPPFVPRESSKRTRRQRETNVLALKFEDRFRACAVWRNFFPMTNSSTTYPECSSRQPFKHQASLLNICGTIRFTEQSSFNCERNPTRKEWMKNQDDRGTKTCDSVTSQGRARDIL